MGPKIGLILLVTTLTVVRRMNVNGVSLQMAPVYAHRYARELPNDLTVKAAWNVGLSATSPMSFQTAIAVGVRISYASMEAIPMMGQRSATVQRVILDLIVIPVVMLSQAPASIFAKQSTFNLVIYNAFTDYWGKAGLSPSHLENNSYTQYNMAVYKESNNHNDEYPIQDVEETDKYAFLERLVNETATYPSTYGCMNLPFYKPMYNFITRLRLRDSAVTVVTQFPPADDDEYHGKLQELAVAFNIRVGWQQSSLMVH
ncbi:hypothetical protein COOONC_07552 [Cooperia oncophora]